MSDGRGKKRESLKRMAHVAILFAALIILAIAVLVEIVLFIYPTMENYKREMTHEGMMAAGIIGDKYIEEYFGRVKEVYYKTPEEIRANEFSREYIDILIPLVDEEFNAAREVLKTARSSGEMENVYFTFFDEEYDRLVYVIDGNVANEAFLPGQWLSNEIGTIDSPATIRRTIRSSWYMPVDYGIASGWTATNYIQLYDKNQAPLGYMTVNVPINSFVRQIAVFLAIYVPVMVLVLLGFSSIAVSFIGKRFIAPINDLAGAARRYMAVSDGGRIAESNIFSELRIGTNDEIEELWETMVDMEDDITKAMRQIKESSAREERLATEMDLAKSIQRAALPTNFPAFPEQERFDIYAHMEPAKEVGGDFYDFFMIDDDHLGMLIADVAGKGVPAALFMMVCKVLLKNRAMQGGKPSEIIANVNNIVCEENKTDMFVTAWLGILTVSTGEVIAANAGHEYPYITDENGEYLVFSDPHGVVIGALPDMRYEDYYFTLNKGGKIFVYTDGVAEAQNEKEELFGLARIAEALNRHRDADPRQLVDSMKEEVDAYAGLMEQFDDITMLCVHYKG